MLDFVIIETDLALNRYFLWPWDYSAHALYYAFWKNLLLLACFVVIKYAVFIWILEFQWLMQVHGHKYLQDYRRPFRPVSQKKNEHI